MKQVVIKFPFTYSADNGAQTKFTPGTWDLEDEVADHWFVQAHLQNPPKHELKVGTPEYAREAMKKIARRRILDAAIAEDMEAK